MNLFILQFIPLFKKQQMKLCSLERNDSFRDIRKKQFNLYSQQKLQFRELHRNQQTPDYTLPQYYALITKGVPTEFRSAVWGSLLYHHSNKLPEQYQFMVSDVDAQIEHLKLPQKLTIQTKMKKAESTTTQNSYDGFTLQTSLTNANNNPEQKSKKIIQTLNNIQLDLPRTFPDLPDLHNDPQNYKKLTRLLSVFSFLYDDIGYIQGMTEIGSLILLETNNQYQSFEVLSTLLCRTTLRDFYVFDEPKIRNMCLRVEDRLKKTASQLYHVLLVNEIETRMFVIGWIMTMFTRCFQIDSILNVWDIIFANKVSPSILTEVCIAVLVSRKKKIMNQGNPSKIVKMLLHTKLELTQEQWVLQHLRKTPKCLV